MAKPVRVLVVDDSAYVRLVVTRLLGGSAGFEVIGQARDGLEALSLAEKLMPDVITLDVEMPAMDGLQVLRTLLPRRRVPVVMLSSLTQQGADVTLEALRLGAVDVVGKPGSPGVPDLEAVRFQLLTKVRAAASARVSVPEGVKPVSSGAHASARGTQPATSALGLRSRPDSVPTVLIASSTGGPGALHALFSALPGDLPAALAITQHMPPAFTEALARRLNDNCPLTVREAAEGDVLQPGVALVARGDHHMIIGPQGIIHLSSEPPVWGVRPAADPMMISAAENLRSPLIGVVLTGMGQDGAQGVLQIARAGGVVIAESEESAVIYGMPKAAKETGCCEHILPLSSIAARLAKLVRERVTTYRSQDGG
jgi:two-component system, chemotaxis family, protein-glutamate methylesterase/glutaminase